MSQDRTGADRVARHRQRRKASGLVEIRAWVQPDQAEDIRAYLAYRDGEALPLAQRRAAKRFLERAVAATPPAAVAPAPPAPAAVPPPAPAQRIEPNGWAIKFKDKPKFELRERLKKAGFTFEAQRGIWIILKINAPSDDKLYAAINAAGGNLYSALI